MIFNIYGSKPNIFSLQNEVIKILALEYLNMILVFVEVNSEFVNICIVQVKTIAQKLNLITKE